MLENLLIAFPDRAGATWTAGQAFADPVEGAEALAAELDAHPLDLIVGAARRHRLEVRVAQVDPAIVTHDVIAARARDGEAVLTWAAPHTLVGTLGAAGSATLSDLDGTPCTRRGQLTTCMDGDGALVLATCGPLFALARGRDAAQARARALAGVTSMPWQQAEARLASLSGTTMAERREI